MGFTGSSRSLNEISVLFFEILNIKKKGNSFTRILGILPDFLQSFDKFFPCQRFGVLQSSGQFGFGVFSKGVLGSELVHNIKVEQINLLLICFAHG
jgi:hypothetical protein